MKKSFNVYIIEQKTICVPFNAYYAEPNQWIEETVRVLSPTYNSSFATEEEAIAQIKSDEFRESYPKAEFTILPVYYH